MPNKTHYNVLGVGRKATSDEIQASYDAIRASRAQAQAQARDTGAADDAGNTQADSSRAETEKKEWQDREDEAYRVLMDEKERAKYDASLAEADQSDQSKKSEDETNQSKENAVGVVSSALKEASGTNPGYKEMMATVAAMVEDAEKRLSGGAATDSLLSKMAGLREKVDAAKTWIEDKVRAMTEDTSGLPSPAENKVDDAASNVLSAASAAQPNTSGASSPDTSVTPAEADTAADTAANTGPGLGNS